ncbi:MAG: carnitine dehydratase [Pseudonocardia sp. SCN 72-86]|nr:MAG: carnitine dehydratase [Pseudonocardia sp. SCN 72-86]
MQNDTPPSSGTPKGPLHGVLIADFSRVLAGPYATMLLADLGADVIKIESRSGDDTRHWTPPMRGEVGTYFISVNRNKRSIALDLSDQADREVAASIADRADVLVENLKPGGMARFALDYPSVSERNPGIVYCSISGFGSGKGSRLPGYDLLAQGISGLMALTGDPDGAATRSGISVFDVTTGLHAAIGILAALHHRDATGTGQHVETNLLSSALSAMVNQSSAYVAGGVVPRRMGQAHLSIFPYEPFPTADGELIVVAANDGQFRRLCEVLEMPWVATDPRFARAADRNLNRGELAPLLIQRLAHKGSQEWFALLTAAGLPCGPINTVEGGIRTATDLGLEPVVLAGGTIPTVRNPLSFSATPPHYEGAPPDLDADGDQIRRWLCAGRTDSMVAAKMEGPASTADQ